MRRPLARSSAPTPGGPWPAPRHAELIRAALGRGEAARTSLARWEAHFDPARIDPETLALLPLLFHNLQAQGIPSAFAAKYRAVYRRSWYRNQLLFAAVTRAIARLYAAGIPTMLLKGAALSRAGYGDDGARAMGDCDVLVPADRAAAAATVLETAGLAPAVRMSPALIRSRHSAPFRDGTAGEIDLHWHALTEDLGPGVDDDLWAAAQPLEWRGLPTRVPCPADHLLLVIAHGSHGGPNVSPVHWIADALVLLRGAGPAVDWERLLDQAARRDLSLTVRRALDHLATAFAAPVPDGVRAALARRPVSVTERLEYALKVRPAARAALGNLPGYWFAHVRLSRRLGRRPGGLAFLRFARDRRQVDTAGLVRRVFLWPARPLGWLTAGGARVLADRARRGAAVGRLVPGGSER